MLANNDFELIFFVIILFQNFHCELNETCEVHIFILFTFLLRLTAKNNVYLPKKFMS